jgi:hypothetical protein
VLPNEPQNSVPPSRAKDSSTKNRESVMVLYLCERDGGEAGEGEERKEKEEARLHRLDRADLR